MPKRTTLTFTSENNPHAAEQELFVYYCKYSGRHALTTDVSLSKLPRRKMDNSRVLDTEEFFTKLYTADGGARLIKRHNGKIERQLRLNVGVLPVAYKTEADGRYLYILDNALTSYAGAEGLAGSKRPPVPPCIKRAEGGSGSEVRLELEDKAAKAALIKISADAVRLQVCANIAHADAANQELLQFVSRALGCRITKLSLLRGSGSRSKVLLVEGMAPQQVYDKLQERMQRAVAEAEGRTAAKVL